MKKKDKGKRKRKKAGNLGKSVPEGNATDAKWLNTIQERFQEVTAVAERIGAFIAANPKCLSVPDAWTEKEFIRNATRVYREAHIPTLKRGPRPKEATSIQYLHKLSDELGQELTQYKMIQSLIDDRICSVNTAGKYAKLYRFSCLSNEGRAQLSQTDQQWLRKNFGSESLSPAWWMDRSHQWFEAVISSSGVGEEIRKIFSGEYTDTEIRQMREDMDKLKWWQFKKAADQQQQRDLRKEKDAPTKKARPKLR